MSSLRRRLLLGLLAGLLLLLGASAVLLYGTIRGRVLGQVDEGLERLAGVLAHMVEQDGSRLDFDELRESRAAAGQDGQQILYRIGRSDGAVLFESDPSAAALGAPPAPPPCSADLTLADGAPARALARSFQPRREPAARLLQVEAPRLWIWIAQDVAPQRRFLAGLRWALLLGGALTALAMAVLVLFVVRGALAPLQRVASAAEAIDAATLDRRFPEAVPAELAPITRRLNDLLARLQRAFAREREFNAAVAHELRTPVAELRALAEGALRRAARGGEEADLAGDAFAIALQMERMVSALLALQRYQAGEAAPQPVAVPLAELVRETWRELRARPAGRGVTLREDLPPAAALWADPALLRTILHVLLDNAAEHAPEHSLVQASAARVDGLLRLEIENPAPELEPADLPRLFDAFWRKDGARRGNGHLGLGLHLAAAAAAAAGMHLEAELAEPRRLRMRLSGPAADHPNTGPLHCA